MSQSDPEVLSSGSDVHTDEDDVVEVSEETALNERSERQLATCQEELTRINAELDSLTAETSSAQGDHRSLKLSMSRIAILNGDTEKLQGVIDGINGAGDSATAIKAQRKALTESAHSAGDRVLQLRMRAMDMVKESAELTRIKGNDLFKQGDYAGAIELYSEAIKIDPQNVMEQNHLYHANRAACYQNLKQLEAAVADAKQAVKLNVSYVRGYVHLANAQVAMGSIMDAANTLASTPLELQANPEIAALKNDVQTAVKDRGNDHYKAGRHDEAIAFYGVGIRLNKSNHVLFSNRSACYQAKKFWKEAILDAREVVKIEPTFAKGYLHLAKSLLQLGNLDEAREALHTGEKATGDAGVFLEVKKSVETAEAQRRERLDQNASSAAGKTAEARALELKERGNTLYKNGDYPQAMAVYSQAISAAPHMGALYGNRAACWMMLKQYTRAIDDCSEGLKLEKDGDLYKVRMRQATALTHIGLLERAVDVLTLGLGGAAAAVAEVKAQLSKTQDLARTRAGAYAAFEKSEFSVARRSVARVIEGGVSDDKALWVLSAQCHAKLKDNESAARDAQKAIALDSDCLEAYLIRADALHYMGQTDKACKHLSAALERDPDCARVVKRLKALRRIIADTKRVQDGIKAAMDKRQFGEAVTLASEGLQIDPDDGRLACEMYTARARAHQFLALSHKRGDRAGADAAADPAELEGAAWKRCLQDCTNAQYHDDQQLAPYLMRAQALQSLERWEEAVAELEKCVQKGPGQEDRQVHEKLQEAQFLLKKSKRKDLYKLLGVTNGSSASEKEIRTAYKREALKWHPDRHSSSTDEEKAAAEARFKEIGEGLEILTTPIGKKLWDEGHDIDTIKEKMQEQKARAEQGARFGGGGFPGHGGFGGF